MLVNATQARTTTTYSLYQINNIILKKRLDHLDSQIWSRFHQAIKKSWELPSLFQVLS